MGAPFTAAIPGGGTGRLLLATRIDAPRLWTAETPNLYSLRLTLRQGSNLLHTVSERFGFRTFEVRKEGLFLNGQRILLKGVGRHAFRPETGRALDTQDSYDDIRLIQAMNMNSVRMTHYPPDVAFLQACDELGLYVLDELSGWQHAQDTPVGRRLVREMVTRDVNHPSILFWDNGNEGGWNRELDSEFALYDLQNRAVLHPWEAFNGIDTKHYPTFDDLERRLRGPNLVMPTEVIHGIYDGGAGAGLEDYWNAIARSPFGAGLFLWVFADEGVARTDQDGRIDVFSTYAPDGILGPHHEKEGSFYTARDLFSPVQVTPPVLDEHFNGTVAVENRYDFTSLAQCRFTWKLLRYREPAEKDTAPVVLSEGIATAPAVAPHASGSLTLPLPKDADALALTVWGPDRQELWTSVWPTPALARHVIAPLPAASTTVPRVAKAAVPRVEKAAGEIRLRAGAVVATFSALDGMLRAVRNGSQTFALGNGPRLAFAKPAVANDVEWLPLAIPQEWTSSVTAPELMARAGPPRRLNCIEITLDYPRGVTWEGYKLQISPDGQAWKTIYDATRRASDGKLFEFPPQVVAAVRLSGFRRSDGRAVMVRGLRAGYAGARFPALPVEAAKVTSGAGNGTAWVESSGGGGLTRFRWTMLPDASIRLDYEYSLTGEYAYYGISFDHSEDQLRSVRWLGGGPYRVWKNRLRGVSLGVHEIAYNQVQPGENWSYPESQGYFPGLRWARLDTAAGVFSVTSASPDLYLRVGTPRFSLLNTSPAFPAGDLSFLHAIPAIGSKFVTAEKTGPRSGWSNASGRQTGSLVFRFNGAAAGTRLRNESPVVAPVRK